MVGDRDRHERTLAFAEIAIGQIKALRLPADPRNFEVWYHYATGYNPSLNKTINDILARKGALTDTDIDDIHAAYLSPARQTDRIDTVGVKVIDEIEQVIAMIDAAMGTSTRYSESLADASEQLVNSADRESLRTVVESLVRATKDAERETHALELRLQASKLEINELRHNLEVVRTESLTDPLTSLYNRKFFDDGLAHAVDAVDEVPVSLLMIDIDRFKSFNDNVGHLTGDQVLRLVAACVKQNVKGRDIAARYGGEEFAVVLPNTMLRAALTVADHIRRSVMCKELMKRSTGESLGRVTISVGVATHRKGETPQMLIERADACLYAAKRTGRNKVVCETDPEIAQPVKAKVA
ncbi:MAG: GGDEF domain-containing protein [Casimicrobiaceae bacterium]